MAAVSTGVYALGPLGGEPVTSGWGEPLVPGSLLSGATRALVAASRYTLAALVSATRPNQALKRRLATGSALTSAQ
jgi:hypothetical protein